jgi:Leucine-rich repeat (LRR) protein
MDYRSVFDLVFPHLNLHTIKQCLSVCKLFNDVSHCNELWGRFCKVFHVISNYDEELLFQVIGTQSLEQAFSDYVRMIDEFQSTLKIDHCASRLSLFHEAMSLDYQCMDHGIRNESFLNGLTKINNLCDLCIKNVSPSIFPEVICELTNLRNLNFCYTNLEIPETISKLVNLESFLCHQEAFGRIPDGLFTLTRLQHLGIRSYYPTRLSEKLSELTNLKILGVNNVDIEHIRLPTTLENLEVMSANCPRIVFDLTNLRDLALLENGLTKLSDLVSRLTNLETLKLCNNMMKTLPNEICDLTKLSTLTFMNVPLQQLPESMTSLKNLCNLTLFGAKLAFSLNLNCFPLNSLVLSQCNLTEFPDLSGLTNLRMLDLSGNSKLQEIPVYFTRFEKLINMNLGCCAITSFPEESWRLTSLKSLELRNNNSKNIPENLDQLTNLTSLGFYANILSDLPDSFGNLTNLQTLSLEDNVFSSFPNAILKLSNLVHLSFWNNTHLSSIPVEINHLTKLQKLDLRETKITGIPEYGNSKTWILSEESEEVTQ